MDYMALLWHIWRQQTLCILLFSHLTLWLLIGPKQCNFKRRQSWALHTEAISTTKEDPVTVQRVSIDVERMSMQCLLLTIVEILLTEIPRTGFWILLFCCFRWSVAQAKWRTACVKFLQWRFWQGEWWKSIDEAQSMTWVSSWPFIPCYAGHRPLVTKLTHVLVCHVLLSFDLGRCVDPVRFSLIARSPMVQILLCSNSRSSMQCVPRCTPAEVGLLVVYWQGKHCFWLSRPNIKIEKEVCKFCNLEGLATGQDRAFEHFDAISGVSCDLSTAVELYAQHDIDLAHSETAVRVPKRDFVRSCQFWIVGRREAL